MLNSFKKRAHRKGGLLSSALDLIDSGLRTYTLSTESDDQRRDRVFDEVMDRHHGALHRDNERKRSLEMDVEKVRRMRRR